MISFGTACVGAKTVDCNSQGGGRGGHYAQVAWYKMQSQQL